MNDFIGDEERAVLLWCEHVDVAVDFEAATGDGEFLVVDRSWMT